MGKMKRHLQKAVYHSQYLRHMAMLNRAYQAERSLNASRIKAANQRETIIMLKEFLKRSQDQVSKLIALLDSSIDNECKRIGITREELKRQLNEAI